jgi:hypothetical protein
MKRIGLIGRRSQLIFILAAAFVLAGFAASQEAVTLAYKFPAGTSLSYQISSTLTRTVSIMGQTEATRVAFDLGFSINPKDMKGQDFKLGVVIDTGKLDVESRQSAESSDLSSIRGKGFDMILSAAGKEIDVSGASDLNVFVAGSQYEIGDYFQTFFPDLPDKPVQVGDKWPGSDMVVTKANGTEQRKQTASINTLDGFETVDGYDCARIKVALTGTISADTPAGPLFLKTEGMGTWYFAVKEGVLVKSDEKLTESGSISVQGISANVTGEGTSQAHLIKK